ncbi:MAG: DUF4129 domain-containing protein [Candidatus Natronoplasma sp.]
MTGLLLILFLVASWSIGVVMDLSPTFVESEIESTFGEFDARPIMIAVLIITPLALLMKGRTPTYIAAVFFLPATLIGTYIFIRVGFSWPMFMIGLIVAISAVAIWKGSKDESMGPYLAAVVFIALILVVSFLLGGGELIVEQMEGNGEGISIPWGDPGGHIETAFGGFGTFLLIILVGGILAFLLVQRIIPIIKSSTESKEDKGKLEDQLSSTVDSAVRELREGKDIYSTILRCYQRMCWALEEKGAKNFEFMTPREFEREAIRTLDVPSSKVSEIRKVFELAKYSNYRLEEKERERALKALKELRKELE